MLSRGFIHNKGIRRMLAVYFDCPEKDLHISRDGKVCIPKIGVVIWDEAELHELMDKLENLKLCPGCNVVHPWEHRCYGKDCECIECNRKS